VPLLFVLGRSPGVQVHATTRGLTRIEISAKAELNQVLRQGDTKARKARDGLRLIR
jgi:hypothetical protein